MTYGSLFSGIGGMDLGLDRAGMRCAWQVEQDEFCLRVLARHWPDVVRFRDVRTVTAADLEPVDLIAGGFPCQDISVAGKGVGIDGESSGLWREFARLVGEMRPRLVLVENVPALCTRGADRVLGDLDALGYACWPLVVGARHVGAPHRRDRVWIVAYREIPRLEGGWKELSRQGSGVADSEGGRRSGEGERRQSEVAMPTADDGVADSDGAGLRVEPGRAGGPHWQGAPFPAGPGEADMDDAAGAGRAAGSLPAVEHASGFTLRRSWPARPGEPQHGWEAPRVVHSPTAATACDARQPESPLGRATDGLSRRLAGRHRRAALKALGNACVPQVVELIGRTIVRCYT